MKLVREHINEKFEDESDPVKDLGIGIKSAFNKYIESQHLKYSTTCFIFEHCVKLKKYKFADYMLACDLINLNVTLYPLQNAAYDARWDDCKYMINKGADLDLTIKKTSTSRLPETYKNLVILKDKIEKENF